VEARAAREPRRTALVWLDGAGRERRELTFADVARGARRFANVLGSLGVGAGERAFVMLPRVPEWYDVLLGLFRAGAVAMPATTQLTARDIASRITRAEAVLAVVDEAGAERLAEVADACPTLRHVIVVGTPPDGRFAAFADLVARASDAEPAPRPTSRDDPLLVYFTSGTVAEPKMVMHTHASYGAGHDVTARLWQDLTPDDLHWTVSDTGWAKAGWGMLFGQWRAGAAIFLWDQRGKLDPERLLAVLATSGVTTFCAPPTLYRALVQCDLEAADLSRVRHAVAAGEPLNPEVIRVWRESTGTVVRDGYGQTETVNIVANYPCLPSRPGSMGRPAPGFDVDVVGEGGERLADGAEGSIAVRIEPERPIGLMTGYWRDEAATAAVMRDGWYHTGDRGIRDEEGFLWFVSRDDDVIISASYRIGPFEVESALVEHPAVAESAAVAKPDPDRTAIVKAFVVLAPGHEGSPELAAELQAHVRSVTAPYKYPREIEFVTDLPKTVSGKIRRSELRAREAARGS